ncbi:VOC family protein [Pelagerythrobacter sp.]|uniref:VOC family protein n=1 Tax=Pelagerythrobacter sp. TaxID=2800702 RepID=UPI0035AE040F
MSEDRGAFIWYQLMTPDAAGAREFYRAVVGWAIDERGESLPGGGEYRMIRRADGGTQGGVLTLAGPMASNPAGWLGYIHTPDVDAAAARIIDAGGAVHVPAADMPGVGRMAMVADPQGAVFYLMTPTPPPGDPDAKSDVFDYEKPQRVRWNELQTTDVEAAVALYGELFGWEQRDRMPMGEMGDYLFIHHREGMIGAIMPRMPDVPQSAWTFYFGADDIDRAAQAVTDGGGRLLGEINEIPGGEFAVHCADPAGATFGLVGPRVA